MVYVLDEPTAGLHPANVDKPMAQLSGLVDAGNTVIVVEHEMPECCVYRQIEQRFVEAAT